jgi:hypothetical protein
MSLHDFLLVKMAVPGKLAGPVAAMLLHSHPLPFDSVELSSVTDL